ncbi:nodal-like protein [Elysia marginata]|uniref:Nodal-like protein n=1 Tax=Elysia marginata TaxID=1093978 RepID=A0AAV4H9J3_9GAST|nr:nodal-like protein [Elysia marginata]
MDVRARGRLVNKFTFRENAKPQFEYNVFDVTSIVRPWINTHHGNMSLHIRVSRKLRNHLLLPSKGNSSQSTSLIVLYLEDKEFLKNMYASFTKGDDQKRNSATHSHSIVSSPKPLSSLSSLRARKKRSAVNPDPKKVLLDRTISVEENTDQNNPLTRIARGTRARRVRNRKSKSRRYRPARRENCKMYDFYVDFTVIGWGEWIIHPKRFNSKFCFGQCPSPIEAKYHPTNHAMLQTLMRMKLPNIAPAPCCVPTKLKAVSMLYVEFDEIVVRSHEDMVVDQCGCR